MHLLIFQVFLWFLISEEKWETKIKCLAYLLQVIECRRLLQVIYQIMLKNLTKVNSCVKFKSIFHKMCQKDNIILLTMQQVSWNFINCCLLIFLLRIRIYSKLHVQNLTLLLLGISMTLHKCPKNQAKGKKGLLDSRMKSLNGGKNRVQINSPHTIFTPVHQSDA